MTTWAIVASGLSAKRVDVSLLKGRCKVLAVKECIDLVPFADAVYGCDRAWWQYRRGLPGFKGRKVTYAGTHLDYEIERVQLDPRCDTLVFGEPGRIGCGGNSGFQAMNLALNWGATRLILVGFDMNPDLTEHWYGRNKWPMANNPNEAAYKRWRQAMENAAQQLRARRIDVLNCSPLTSVKAFPVATLEDALCITS